MLLLPLQALSTKSRKLSPWKLVVNEGVRDKLTLFIIILLKQFYWKYPSQNLKQVIMMTSFLIFNFVKK